MMPHHGHVVHVQFSELPVADQDRAIAFYTGALGLRVVRDAPYQEGWRWVELEIPGARTRILLARRARSEVPDEGSGRGPALALIVDDVDALHAAASGAGVTFVQGPAPAPWSPALRYALLRDSEGNTVLVQTAPP
jgi:lactoylglutathione lyase